MAIQAARCSGTDTDKALLHHCVCSPDTRSIASWLLPVVPVLLTSTLPCAVCVCADHVGARSPSATRCFRTAALSPWRGVASYE